MTQPTWTKLMRPGLDLLVKFGAKGTQKAEFLRFGIIQGQSSLVVRKLRKSSGEWTKPVHILHHDVLEIRWINRYGKKETYRLEGRAHHERHCE